MATGAIDGFPGEAWNVAELLGAMRAMTWHVPTIPRAHLKATIR